MVELVKVRVRDGFYVHLRNGSVHGPGTELSLSPDQYLDHAAQVDLLPEESPKKVTAKPQKEVKPNDVSNPS